MLFRHPYTTASIWSSGKITCTGANSEEQARVSARKFSRILQKLDDKYKDIRIKNWRIVNVLGTSVLAAVVFFLVTNFAVWAGPGLFPKNATGLLACYTAGIPFFWNTVLGNIFFGSILFGAYEYASQRGLIARPVRVGSR